MKPGCFASRPGSSKDSIYLINTSSQDEKRPSLINFSLNIIIKGMLVSLTFLRISLPELRGKRFSQSLGVSSRVSLHEFTAVISSEVLRVFCLRQKNVFTTLPTLSEKVIARKVLLGYFSEKKIMFENTSAFDFRK